LFKLEIAVENLDHTSGINQRRQWLFVFLVGLFVTNAITAELISNKLIEIPFSFSVNGSKFGPFITIVGVIPWPVVFILTDLLNEFYGEKYNLYLESLPRFFHRIDKHHYASFQTKCFPLCLPEDCLLNYCSAPCYL